MTDKKADFGVICRHKDTDSSNLSDVFESYGCNTLEAKVAVVDEPLIEELCNVDRNQRFYGTLALKTESANLALQGRFSRTSNRELKIVQVAGETILAAGPIRERSPVDEDELEEELDEYMKEAARIKELKQSGGFVSREGYTSSPTAPAARPIMTGMKKTFAKVVEESNVKMEDEELDQGLDEDLDQYMKEAKRIRDQKRKLVEQSDRATAMKAMEEDFEDDDL